MQGADAINPQHYQSHPSGVECITITEHFPFCVGNAIKYLWRAGLKGDAVEDLEKAKWYVEREIARRRKPTVPTLPIEYSYNSVCEVCNHTRFVVRGGPYGIKVHECANCETVHMLHPAWGYRQLSASPDSAPKSQAVVGQGAYNG